MDSHPSGGSDGYVSCRRITTKTEVLPVSPVLLLIGAAAAVGLLHSILPDHWVPLAVVGRTQRWRLARVARISGLAAGGHVIASLLLAGLIAAVGLHFQTQIYSQQGHIVGAILVVTGVALLVWGFTGHGHVHGPGGHDHGGGAKPHHHSDRRSPEIGLHKDPTGVAGHSHFAVSQEHASKDGNDHPHPHDHHRHSHDSKAVAFVAPATEQVPDTHAAVLDERADGHQHDHVSYEQEWHAHDHSPSTQAGDAGDHEHSHLHDDVVHTHSHRHEEFITAQQKILVQRAGQRNLAGRLATIAVPFGVAASPDLSILPIALAASAYGTGAVTSVLGVFTIVTIATFVGLTVVGTAVGYQIKGLWLEKHSNTITSLVLVAVGIVAYFGL